MSKLKDFQLLEWSRAVRDEIFALPVFYAEKFGFTPNQISFLSCFTGILAALVLFYDYVIFAVALLCVSLFLDGLDGCLARKKHKLDFNGKVIDAICDFTVLSSVGMVISLKLGIWQLGVFYLLNYFFAEILAFTKASQNQISKRVFLSRTPFLVIAFGQLANLWSVLPWFLVLFGCYYLFFNLWNLGKL
jgi:phosphatidylglycerophosphate synthase